MGSYKGVEPSRNTSIITRLGFLATEGQTLLTGLAYTPGLIDVYVNGSRLSLTTPNGPDYTATNGTSITFTEALSANDEIELLILNAQNVVNALTQAVADTMYAKFASVQAYTGAQHATPVAMTPTSGTVTLDLNANNYSATLTGNITLANPTNLRPGQSGVIRINTGTGPFGITSFGNQWTFEEGLQPLGSSTANVWDLYTYYVESSTKIWIGVKTNSKSS